MADRPALLMRVCVVMGSEEGSSEEEAGFGGNADVCSW